MITAKTDGSLSEILRATSLSNEEHKHEVHQKKDHKSNTDKEKAHIVGIKTETKKDN